MLVLGSSIVCFVSLLGEGITDSSCYGFCLMIRLEGCLYIIFLAFSLCHSVLILLLISSFLVLVLWAVVSITWCNNEAVAASLYNGSCMEIQENQ